MRAETKAYNSRPTDVVYIRQPSRRHTFIQPLWLAEAALSCSRTWTFSRDRNRQCLAIVAVTALDQITWCSARASSVFSSPALCRLWTAFRNSAFATWLLSVTCLNGQPLSTTRQTVSSGIPFSRLPILVFFIYWHHARVHTPALQVIQLLALRISQTRARLNGLESCAVSTLRTSGHLRTHSAELSGPCDVSGERTKKQHFSWPTCQER